MQDKIQKVKANNTPPLDLPWLFILLNFDKKKYLK